MRAFCWRLLVVTGARLHVVMWAYIAMSISRRRVLKFTIRKQLVSRASQNSRSYYNQSCNTSSVSAVSKFMPNKLLQQ